MANRALFVRMLASLLARYPCAFLEVYQWDIVLPALFLAILWLS